LEEVARPPPQSIVSAGIVKFVLFIIAHSAPALRHNAATISKLTGNCAYPFL
jgi:hypothetical protein